MKKLNKLFATLVAVLGAGTLSAQTTDVTSTYLTNAGFENSAIFDGSSLGASGTNATPTSGSTLLSGATNVYEISGWTNMTTETSDFARVFTMPYNTTLYVKSNGGNGGQAVTAPSNGSSVTENNNSLLFVEANWCNGATLGIKKDVTLEAGVYELKFDSYVTTNLQYGTSLCGVQVGSTTTYKWPTELNTWTNNSITFVVTSKQSATISMGYTKNSNKGGGESPFLFVDNIQLLHKPFTDVTEANPVDLTSMSGGNWLRADGEVAGTTATSACGGLAGVSEAYQWGNCLAAGDNVLKKSLSNLPSGMYTLEIYCASSTTSSRDNGNYKVTDGDEQYVTLTANDQSVAIPTYNRITVSSVPVLTFKDLKVTDGNLNLAVNIKKVSPNWLMAKVKSITFVGPDKSLEETNFATNIANLNALSTNNVPTAFVTKINDLKSTYGSANAASMTLSELIAANGEIKAVVDLHPSLVSAYANLDTYISVHDNSTEIEAGAKATFKAAIDKAVADANNAVTVEEINNVIPTLEAARQTYVIVAIPTTDYSFDMTFLINNAQVTSATGWTNGGTASGQQYTGAPDNTYLDWCRWSWTGNSKDMYNNVAGLPIGAYSLKAATRAHTSMSGYIYATTTSETYKANIHKVGNQGNDLGGGWGWTEIDGITVTDETLTIGFHVETTTDGVWAGADNFSLYRSFDATAMQSALSGLLEEAKAIITANKPMNATVEATLSSTIDATDVEATDPVEIYNMTTALNEAIADAENSIAAYEAIPAYITKANTIDESIAAGYQTAYDNRTLAKSAETVFQELEVATYNYVTENFEYPVPLSDEWKSDGTHTHAATFYDEHWSGEERAYKNQHDGWGDPKEGYPADSWSIDFEQEVTLPAGEYVFKVAGRKSVDATLELVVTMGETELGTVNDFPNSNAGFGINKAGAASFDANDPAGFAVLTNDKGEVTRTGFGWQWRYVKFALADKATVKVAVHAETSKIYNWVSFGDYTLQMTEETYLNANKPNMDAIEATASALVDIKPMGDDENTALKDALAMTYTTGAQMLAKMNALETAIDNANAWRSTYNTEKGKLVAALERFEADYNDAENGALDYMNKERWATAIAKAQAAAVAKDNLTSHAILTTATTELTVALDAATVSVGEYADLKAAINEANAHYNGGNWGDGAFQRPTSAKESLNTTSAQATYDAATADGEGVTSVTKTLNDAMGAIVLNAPVEGTCYKIVMGDLTWTNNDNATMLATKDKSLVFVKGGQSEAQGLYSINFIGKNDNYAHALTFNAVKDATNQYTISFVDNDGATRYICDGSVTGAGTGTYGIRTTTDAAKALPVEVRATATDGVWNLYNTVAKELLGAQDAGLFTTTRNNNLKIMEAPKHEVTLALSEVGWATLILPFDAELPEGVIAYSCTGTEGEVLTLTEAESLKANTPYLMNGEKSTHTFTGYGLASKDSYTDGLFVGTYVDYQTTVDGKTYVLQNNNGNLAFYLVQETAQPWIRTNRCYMIYEAANGAPVFRIGKGTTGIAPSTLNAQPSTVIYDLMGRKVTTMMKGGMYIVNGKKVVIR